MVGSTMPAIRVISLDCTGTMFTWSASLGTLYNLGFTRAAATSGRNVGDVPRAKCIDARFPAAFRQVNGQWPLFGYHHGVASYDWWKAVAALAVEGSNMSTDRQAFDSGFDEVYRLFQTSEAYKLYADTKPFLRWTKSLRDVQVCALSNVTESYRDAILPELGLDAFVDFGVYSKIVGFSKPDPRSFSLVAERAGVHLSEVLHIGDDAAKDCVGAKTAGCQTLLLDRDGTRRVPAGVDVVRDLAEARQWLEARGVGFAADVDSNARDETGKTIN
eukprot:TRINITY_DN35221_c0_g1_i1.p1 TRINITY_DN35221_c0_g1~~TRINITY_DN35221_c0_g1_i1.p1  ORF type:complete len:274 (-),score=39.20 TRINITY_DN35221_c0_g1_i1:215-1036(-)